MNIAEKSGNKKYKEAVATLSTLFSNAQDLKDATDRQFSDMRLVQTKQCLLRCGMTIEQLENSFSIIHVSGTKGKGSTCAFCEAILLNYGYKTGFFTSPHLVSVCERFRINGAPISEEKFSKYFWHLFRKFEETKKHEEDMPTQFVFMMIMALKIFYSENANVVILEVGVGGEYDCTNIFNKPAVVGISSLGFDHTRLLGKSIEEIAWQKAGIMKCGTVAITSYGQVPAALRVLKERASERNCRLFEAPSIDKYTWPEGIPKIGIEGPLQHLNVSLALQLVNCFLNPGSYREAEYDDSKCTIQQATAFEVCEQMCLGLRLCTLAGRTQIVEHAPTIRYYLDGAHTSESIKQCAFWYNRSISRKMSLSAKMKKVLVFNISGDRPHMEFFRYLIACEFHYVFFCPSIIGKGKNASQLIDLLDLDEEKALKQCHCMCEDWLNMDRYVSKTKVFSTASEVVHHISTLKQRKESLHVLVTGSMYLVGTMLYLLNHQRENKISLRRLSNYW